MATFDFRGKSVYYELVGEGHPLLLLNGIMMSTKSWTPFLETFQQGGNKLILVDLLDQGQSEPMDHDFPQELQADMLNELLEHLKLPSVTVFGTSYGGEVALNLAVKYPRRVNKMILANTVARTNAWLKEIGEAWNLAVSNPLAYYSTTIPVIYSPDFYDRKADWMQNRKKVLTQGPFNSKAFLDRMARLTRSAESHDVTARLIEIDCPVLLISSDQDHITPIEEQVYLRENIKNAAHVVLPKTGHASFYERPDLFVSVMMGFVNHRTSITII